MGIGPALLDMHLDWMREGIIKPCSWVLEIGAQQFDCAGDPD